MLPIAQALAVELGCEPVVVAEESRPAYAEALATATEFSRSIVRQSTELLAQAGVPIRVATCRRSIHSTVDHALSDAGSRSAGDPTATIDG